LGRLKRAWLAGALGKSPSATSATLERCTQYGAGLSRSFSAGVLPALSTIYESKEYCSLLDLPIYSLY
jgi:hypothetical protein